MKGAPTVTQVTKVFAPAANGMEATLTSSLCHDEDMHFTKEK